MKYAIETLKAEIDNCRANEPIYRRSGNDYEANLCQVVAKDCEAGMVVLQRLLNAAVGVGNETRVEEG
jgi:hypothetical protein